MSTQWTNDEQTKQRLLQQSPAAKKIGHHKLWLWVAGGILVLVAISNCAGNQTHYTNRDGHRIAVPGQTSTGATARCRDGSWSYSQHRNGTCSQQGGVREWLN